MQSTNKIRIKKIIISTGAFFVVVLAVVVVFLMTFDLNHVKPWFEEKVGTATHRTFSVRGDLSLSWQRPEHEKSWRRWIPWPHLRAKDVVLGNADWSTISPEMARIMQVDFNINPLLLVGKTIAVQSLVMTEPRLILEQDSKGRNNWSFPKSEENKFGWQFTLQDVVMTQGTIRYVDPVKHADMVVRADTLSDNSVEWTLSGKFNDEFIAGDARTGSLLSIQASGVPYPVDGKIVVGETRIFVNGTITDPTHPSAIDANLKILGASMADLFPLGGVLLPETPKFSMQGRLTGTLGRGKLHLRYEKFKGQVGSSDIDGTLEYTQKEPRPLLQGEVVSHHLKLSDLTALMGAGEGRKKLKDEEIKQPPDKVLPVSPFKTERWGKMDADVQFHGNEITGAGKLPFDNVRAHIKMSNGVLSLDPLDFGIAGGRLTADLKIDGHASPAKAQMNISARHIKLKALFPSVKEMHASLGEIHGDAKLSATGNSFAALAATSNGELLALMSQGTVSEFVMEAIGLNVGRMVVSKLFGDRQVELNCMATNFHVTDGVMRPLLFVVDTDDAVIHLDGDINLARENLDLTIYPKSKGVRIFSLRSPLYIKGTFKKPDVGINKTVVGLKAGAAIALGAVATPLVALLALTQPNPAKDNPCGILLPEVDRKPVAPPSGKKGPHTAKQKIVSQQSKANTVSH
ncbi:MAG: AsmA family protein [Burkholderiaceae bacterium]